MATKPHQTNPELSRGGNSYFYKGGWMVTAIADLNPMKAAWNSLPEKFYEERTKPFMENELKERNQEK